MCMGKLHEQTHGQIHEHGRPWQVQRATAGRRFDMGIRQKFNIGEAPLTWTLKQVFLISIQLTWTFIARFLASYSVHVSWILFKKACLSVHVSGLVTCVTLTWTLPKLEKVRKSTNIIRAYIFSIFSVLVCIPEGTILRQVLIIAKKWMK